MDFGYTEKPPSSYPPGRPGGDPPGPSGGGPPGSPSGGPSGLPGGRPPGGPPGPDPLAEEDPLDRAGPAEALLEDPLGTSTAQQEMVSRRPPGSGSSTSSEGSRSSSAR